MVIDTIRWRPPPGMEGWKGGMVEWVVCLLPCCLLPCCPAACCPAALLPAACCLLPADGAELIFVSVIVCLWGGERGLLKI